MSKCAFWLAGLLGNSALECRYVKQAASEAGFSRFELKRARQELGVVTKSVGTPPHMIFWSLPKEVMLDGIQSLD